MHIYRFSQSGLIRVVFCIFVLGTLTVSLWCCQKECYAGKEEDMSRYRLAGELYIPEKEEVVNNGFIYRYHHGLMREKGLAEGDEISSYYLCLQAVYRANLDAYLLETLDIRALDRELGSSELGFVSHRPGEKNLYERESSMGLEFLYLRNNLYIEYLSEKQLEMLKTCLRTGDTAVTEELKQMVKETYPEVIRVRGPAGREERDGFLYPEEAGREPVIPNQALVLGITDCMEYDEEGNILPGDHMREKREYLNQLKEKKEEEYSRILGITVYIQIS